MLSYINTTHLYQIYEIYSTIYSLSLVDTISKKAITIVKLESWNQFLESNQTDLLFPPQEEAPAIVYDIKGLVLNHDILKQVLSDQNIYIYNSETKLLAAEKKLISYHKGKIIEPNIFSKLDVEKFAIKYLLNNNYALSKTDLSILLQLTLDLFEIIDIIDFAFLSNDPHTALTSLIKKDTTPIFMLPLRSSGIIEDLPKWVPYLKNEDSQLILSMLFTKISKHNSQLSNSLLKSLIKIDNLLKSQTQLSSVLLLKLFIWNTKNENF